MLRLPSGLLRDRFRPFRRGFMSSEDQRPDLSPLSFGLRATRLSRCCCRAPTMPTQSDAMQGSRISARSAADRRARSTSTKYGSAIVGQAQTSSGANHAFLFTATATRRRRTWARSAVPRHRVRLRLGRGVRFLADGIRAGARVFHAVSFRNTGMKDLGTLGGTWAHAAYGADYRRSSSALRRRQATSGHARSRTNGTMSALPFDWGGDSAWRETSPVS